LKLMVGEKILAEYENGNFVKYPAMDQSVIRKFVYDKKSLYKYLMGRTSKRPDVMELYEYITGMKREDIINELNKSCDDIDWNLLVKLTIGRTPTDPVVVLP